MTSKILLITEGEKTEVNLLGSRTHGLLSLIGADHEIVPVGQSIYELYDRFVEDEYFDMVEYLIENDKLVLEDGVLTKNAFSAVYLIFDLDSHYQKYADEKIKKMLDFFDDETNNGKLYINYPMVEAFYDLQSGVDKDFFAKKISLKELTGKKYKRDVNISSHYGQRKNKLSNIELSFIIEHHLVKAMTLLKTNDISIDYLKLLEVQLTEKNINNDIFVLSTLAVLPVDYNPELAIEKITKKTKVQIDQMVSFA